MEITETLYVKTRNEWRDWLSKNYNTKKEIWLIYYKKHTGKERILYDDAVEEALCFGWIDSTVKKIDEEKYAQKYTPRNVKSNWSELNIKRVEKLIKEEKMTDTGLSKFNPQYKNYNKVKEVEKTELIIIPADLLSALKRNKIALKYFNNFAPSYKILSIKWIDNAKKEITRQKRIKEVVNLASENKKIGMK